MIIFSRIGLLFLIFFGILFLCVPHDVSAAEPNKIMVYFYSAESNINNFRSLKMEWDAYHRVQSSGGHKKISRIHHGGNRQTDSADGCEASHGRVADRSGDELSLSS